MLMREPPPSVGKQILFWDDEVDARALQPLLDALGVFPGGRKHGQPKDHVRHDVPWADRVELSRALQLRPPAGFTGGDVLMGYMGWANCRMCGLRLGTRNFFSYGFVWPEMAGHYVLDHKVWTPECDEMLAAVRRSFRRAP
jgi:hypothetical protein